LGWRAVLGEEQARYLYRQPLGEQCARSLMRQAAGTAWAEDGDDIVVAVCTAGEEKVVGKVVLKLASARARQVEIGWVFNPGYSGRGYATEAARATVALAFAELGVHRLFARLDVLNTVSMRV
jgi:RimJ/RimL family protein N-acetyltransferase